LERKQNIMTRQAAVSPRILPVEPPYTPEIAAELRRWMPTADVEPLKLFRTLGQHLPLAQAMYALGHYCLGRRLSVGMHEREVVIDRVCARCGCEYEWGVHAVAFGDAAGLGEAQLQASAIGGADDPAWTAADALLVRLVDELHDSGHVSSPLWAALAERWSSQQLLDLLVLAGWYHVISYVANGAGVALEEWAMRFPQEAIARAGSGVAESDNERQNT
jgi:alkylhydroperoxidase family enzyme